MEILGQNPLYTLTLVVNMGIIQILMGQKRLSRCIHIYINGSKVYSGKSSFIFHSKNVAVNIINDSRLIFNRSYISTKRVYIKMSPTPCSLEE